MGLVFFPFFLLSFSFHFSRLNPKKNAGQHCLIVMIVRVMSHM